MTKPPASDNQPATSPVLVPSAEAETNQELVGQYGLGSIAFLSLLVTQFLTAVNDNIFRWLVIGVAKQYVKEEEISYVLVGGTAGFVLPYLVLASPAGYLADRFSKSSVIFVCKVAEIVIMALGVGAIALGHANETWAFYSIFAVVSLMGAQSALFAPARAGSLPEVLRPELLSKANGFFGLATVIATVIGMIVGCKVSDYTVPKGLEHLWVTAAVLIGVAVVGTITAWPLKKLPAGAPWRKFPWDFPVQTYRDGRTLASNLPMLRVAVGILFFYAIGSLAQLNIDQLATEGGANAESDKVPLLLALIAGVCVGNVLAGYWSGDHVELGILPLGAAGIALSSLLFCTVPVDLFQENVAISGGVIWAMVLLVTLGISAGLFCVPLEAYLQHRSERASRGSILSASNFLTFSGICLSSILYAVLRIPFWSTAEGTKSELFSPQSVFLLCGLLTIGVFFYIVLLLPQATVRFMMWLLASTIYRITIKGRHNLPATGGALLAPNHITWIDGLLLMLTSSRPIRMVAYAPNIENPWVKRLADMFGVIPIHPARPKTIVQAFRTAREALANGELVCIFPEGGLTRSGQVQAFRPGTMKILDGVDVPVIPVYFDGLWGSIFSFEAGKFFWKWPRRIPYPMSIHFGPPIAAAQDMHAIRQAVLALGSQATKERSAAMLSPTRWMIRQCKARKKTSKIADSMGGDLTGGELLARALVLRRLLRRGVLANDEKIVGVLLPPSTGGVVVNMALALDKRVSANLNYTVTSDVMNACIAQAKIKHILTSRKFIDKLGEFKLDAEFVYLEDFATKPTLLDKIAAGLAAYVLPTWWVESSLGLQSIKPDDVLTIIFTSGSTGTPKGVMLTHQNIGSNVEAIDQVVRLKSSDVLVGILPFFHSFGYTVTLWGVAALNIKGIYHYSPLDAKQIGKLTKKHGGTLLLSTPTFMRTYLRRCEKDEFATLDVVVCGAEKLPKELADAYEEKFGVRPVEGYGTTELSPLVSVNIPPTRRADNFQTDCKEGSVGRTVPGVSAKVLHPETGEVCKAGEPGMLWIGGPNVMKGYLDQPELTNKVVKEGWYQTGDIAYLDDEGFIFITGRLSRFSKIGGEMVPHIKIVESLFQLLGEGEDEKPRIAVTSVSDERKGERLIVLHTQLPKTTDELRKGLSELGLPNLFIPGADGFLLVDELPVLGTGKLDLKAMKSLAEKLTADEA